MTVEHGTIFLLEKNILCIWSASLQQKLLVSAYTNHKCEKIFHILLCCLSFITSCSTDSNISQSAVCSKQIGPQHWSSLSLAPGWCQSCNWERRHYRSM